MNINTSKDWLILFAFLAFSVFLVLQVDVGYQLADTFHEGEYVGLVWHMFSYYAGVASFPLVIHGAMDFLPSIFAKIIYGGDRIIVGTRIINSFIVIATWTFFLDFCWKLTKKSGKNAFWILIPVLLLLLASRHWGIALALHHAFIGPRDVFLIISLWAFISYKQCNGDAARIIYIVTLISSGIFGLYWSYDRGVMAALVTMVFAINILYRKKKNEILILLMASVVIISFLEYTKIVGSAWDLASNVLYWIQNSKEVWGNSILFPISLQALMLPATLLALMPLVLIAVNNEYKLKINREVAIVVLLMVIELLMIKTIFNRAGLPRTSWGLWPLIAIFIYGVSRTKFGGFESENNSTKNTTSITGLQILVVAIPALSLTIAFSNFFYAYPNFSTFSAFKSNIKSPKLDTDLVSADVKNVSSKLALLQPGCAFGWTNEGVIALLAHLPLCTKFNYAVHSTLNGQSTIIKQLVTDNPSAIVFSTPNWSIKIDEKHMKDRLPDVFSFIEKNYPYEIFAGQYSIRAKSPEKPLNYSYQRLLFSSGGNGFSYLQEGWSSSEAWGTWSVGKHATVALGLPADAPKTDYEITIEAQGFVVEKKHLKQKVDVLVNKKAISSLVYDGPDPVVHTIKIPKNNILSEKNSEGRVNVEFILNNAISPSDLEISGDGRKLGIGLISLQIKPKD